MFGLGCVYLDILTFLLKRKPSDFARHRGAKWSRTHKTSKLSSPSTSTLGSGSASVSASASGSIGQVCKVDTSFHANLDKVETWMAKLEHDAFDLDHPAFRAVGPLVEIIKGMLRPIPGLRPPAAVVREKVRGIFVRSRLEGLPRCAETGMASTSGKGEAQAMKVRRNVTGGGGGDGGGGATAARGGGAASPSTVIAEVVEKMPMPFGTVRAKGVDGSITSGRDNAPAPTVPFTTSRAGALNMSRKGALLLRRQVLG